MGNIIPNPWETWKEQNVNKCPVWEMHIKHGKTLGEKCHHCTSHYVQDTVIEGETEEKKIRGKVVKVAKHEKIPHCLKYHRQDVRWPKEWDACGLWEDARLKKHRLDNRKTNIQDN